MSNCDAYLSKYCLVLITEEIRSSYSPHPKDGDVTVFPGVYLSTPGVQYPSPRFFPRSLVKGPFQGVPQSWLGDILILARGYPRAGYPQDRTGVPPPGQNSRKSTCYVAGGMPLAFTQEDFLVNNNFLDSVDPNESPPLLKALKLQRPAITCLACLTWLKFIFHLFQSNWITYTCNHKLITLNGIVIDWRNILANTIISVRAGFI